MNCLPLTFAQKVLLGFLFAVMVLVLITSFTGHAYLVVIAFLRFLDQLTLGESYCLLNCDDTRGYWREHDAFAHSF